jgi:GT2 family glycosyltransferase
MPDVSIIVPYAQDWPHLYFTLNQCAMLLVNSKLSHEIVVVGNNSGEPAIEDAAKLVTARDFADAHKARFIISQIPSNGVAANLGAKVATGKYLAFMDSHVVLSPNIFTECIKVIDNDIRAGLVHAPMCHTGIPFNPDFSYMNNKRCYQYLYKEWDLKKFPGVWYLNTGAFTGTYNHFNPGLEPRQIVGCGHGFFMIRKDTWDKIGGYHTGQRAYGGRESFVTFKSLLFGFHNYTVPAVHHIHYNGRRLYEWKDDKGCNGNDLFWRNAMTQAYSIGGEEWLAKTYAWYERKAGKNNATLIRLREEAIDLSTEERKFVLANQQFPFDDLWKLADERKWLY